MTAPTTDSATEIPLAAQTALALALAAAAQPRHLVTNFDKEANEEADEIVMEVHEDRHADDAVRCLSAARELRAKIQHSTLEALARLANPELIDESRLFDPKTRARRKPRVELWAEIDMADTVSIFWRPLRDADAPPLNDASEMCSFSDYLSLGGAELPDTAGQLLLSLADDEYEPTPGYCDEQGDLPWATRELCRALEEALQLLATTLDVLCDVSLGAWPEYCDGMLYAIGAAGRAYGALSRVEQDAEEQLFLAEGAATIGVGRYGLYSVDEFITLRTLSTGPDDLRRLLMQKRGGPVDPQDLADVDTAVRKVQTSLDELLACRQLLAMLD